MPCHVTRESHTVKGELAFHDVTEQTLVMKSRQHSIQVIKMLFPCTTEHQNIVKKDDYEFLQKRT